MQAWIDSHTAQDTPGRSGRCGDRLNPAYACCMTGRSLRTIGRLLIGSIVGFVIGAIVAVNIVIAAGTERGYESSLAEVFEENAVVGVLTVIILVSGPVVGTIVAYRSRRSYQGQ